MTTNNTQTRAARSHSLYRAVLSLAVAALIAASIPFAAIYVSTVHRPPVLSALAPGPRSGQSVKLITTASGRQISVPVSGNPSTAVTASLTTHTSGSAGGND
jgi:hypothetical protein